MNAAYARAFDRYRFRQNPVNIKKVMDETKIKYLTLWRKDFDELWNVWNLIQNPLAVLKKYNEVQKKNLKK